MGILHRNNVKWSAAFSRPLTMRYGRREQSLEWPPAALVDVAGWTSSCSDTLTWSTDSQRQWLSLTLKHYQINMIGHNCEGNAEIALLEWEYRLWLFAILVTSYFTISLRNYYFLPNFTRVIWHVNMLASLLSVTNCAFSVRPCDVTLQQNDT